MPLSYHAGQRIDYIYGLRFTAPAGLRWNLLGIKIEKAKKGSKSPLFLYEITGIPADTDYAEKQTYLDITIAGNGDAFVTIRDPFVERLAAESGKDMKSAATICFKTAEKGGKFPVLNQVFRAIAEDIAGAKKEKPAPGFSHLYT